jgi:MoaA/NifB/PqqE/SkfB family radical SAM enzyme
MLFFNEIKTIEINPTELCNLKCVFCPRSTFYPNLNEHMSLDIAKEIRNQMLAAKFSGVLSITGRGEPTLHPNFEEYVSIFVGYGWKLKMNTNGKRFEQYESFILKHFDDIHYNCYVVDAIDTHKKYGHYKNVKVIPKKLNEWFSDATNRAGSFPTNSQPDNKRCEITFHKMFIDIDGTYRLCCHDWKEKISLGNIYEQNIVDYIEDNIQLAMYRKNLIHGNRDLLPCISCDYNIECTNRQHNISKYLKIIEMADL